MANLNKLFESIKKEQKNEADWKGFVEGGGLRNTLQMHTSLSDMAINQIINRCLRGI